MGVHPDPHETLGGNPPIGHLVEEISDGRVVELDADGPLATDADLIGDTLLELGRETGIDATALTLAAIAPNSPRLFRKGPDSSLAPQRMR